MPSRLHRNPRPGWALPPTIQLQYTRWRVSTRAAPEERLFLTEACETLLQQGWLVDDDFAPTLVPKLREEFVSRFANPLDVNAERFIWDYWHVPDQYSLMRTTAEAFFSDNAYSLLEQRVLEWAATLGCRSCSPMWISYYVDSHAQQLHTDAPHGPFAFVLSLTDFDNRRFSGGETQLLKQDAVLTRFWEDAGSAKEVNQLFDFIEPRFGRLTVFDGRIPHGVREVRGVRDPREARLVVHGWFTVRWWLWMFVRDRVLISDISDICRCSSLPDICPYHARVAYNDNTRSPRPTLKRGILIKRSRRTY